MTKKRNSGWYGEPYRHKLASQGIKTSTMKAKALKKWERADNYMGEDYSDYYVAYSRSRDSSILKESNCNVFKEKMKKYDGVEIARFNHWAHGWIELILVHEDDEDAIDEAEDLHSQMEFYPVLDEGDFSEREYEKALNSIKGRYGIDEEEAKKIYNILPDEETQSYDGFEIYPSDEALQEALVYVKLGEGASMEEIVDRINLDKLGKDAKMNIIQENKFKDLDLPKGINPLDAKDEIKRKLTEYEIDDILYGEKSLQDVVDEKNIMFSKYHPSQTKLTEMK